MRHVSALILPAALLFAAAPAPRPAALPAVAPNDNRASGGTLHDGVLDIKLDTRDGVWHPYGADGPPVTIPAFGEVGKPLETPGPLIRVKVGTRVRASVTNSTKAPLVVHGLTSRRTPMPDTLVIPAGATRTATFIADVPGTYFYWGSTSGASFDDRKFDDAQLNGALIIDAADAKPRPERIFVVQWRVPRTGSTDAPDGLNGFFTVNGMPWPRSERLSYTQGDSVHWRIINATVDVHPLHLHGFYFRVNARGDEQRDTLYWTSQERMAVTELMRGGTTMNLSWFADRPGAWVYHCHLNWHVVPNPILDPMQSDSVRLNELYASTAMNPTSGTMPMSNHAEMAMGGLVIAMTIKPKGEWHPYSGPREHIRLLIESDSQPGDKTRRFGYVLARGNDTPSKVKLDWPGPAIVLRKGQPTSIWVINRVAEPSQVHWHGLEIDSYYDGVAGLSSNGALMSREIQPGDSVEVTLTPPRAGSFMYHTHLNDMRQQLRGLYGPIVVLDAGETWNQDRELIFQVAENPNDDVILNGEANAPPRTVVAGEPYRVRLMNASIDSWDAEYWLTDKNGASLDWKSLAKDGFDLPAWQRKTKPARQPVSIGETYDFHVTFPDSGTYTMEARNGDGSVAAKQVLRALLKPGLGAKP
jgi:FtsP/CotA-like multicopper oxidase with cupredoxin domain